MIAVILAGGKGTRLSEETQFKPKPLVEAGGHPLLWHVMKNYSNYGIRDFVILAGYRGEQIKEYFSNYWMRSDSVTFDLGTGTRTVLNQDRDDWNVTVLDTGLETETGGRLLRARKLLGERFLLAYGDGVADVDISKLLEFHNQHEGISTLTAVKPPARFGALTLSETRVASFQEKPDGEGGWVNGGFFVLNSDIFKYFTHENPSFEFEVLPILAQENQLHAYKHYGYWQPVDTLRDLHNLSLAITEKKLPWLGVDSNEPC